MWNAGLDKAQAEVKIARRNINNLRYTDDTTLVGESEEELKHLLMKVKGCWTQVQAEFKYPAKAFFIDFED